MKKSLKTANHTMSLPKSRKPISSSLNSKRHSTIPSRSSPNSQPRSSLPDKKPLKMLSIFTQKPQIQAKIAVLAAATSSLFKPSHDLPRLLNSSSTEFSNQRPESQLNCNSPFKRRKNSGYRVLVNKNECVSIREASKIKEWALKAKPEIERMWRRIVNTAHGIEPINVVFADYKVFVGKGNNAGLVKKLFLARPWWQITENKEEANFVWTQWKDKSFLESLKPSAYKPTIKPDAEVFPLVCSYKAQIATRVYKTVDVENLGLQLIRESLSYLPMRGEKLHPEQQKVHNKLEYNECISNKKDLLNTMKRFYSSIGKNIHEKLPLSFIVTGDNDPELKEFIKVFNKLENSKQHKKSFKNLWIVKPGEFTNRGQGITVCKNLQEIMSTFKSVHNSCYIIQKYIEKPLLVHKRKFDIRCYSLMSSFNGILLGYFYLDGYLRTSSTEYSIKDTRNLLIHLTNDAIQKQSPEYGKFESGNKLSYKDFQKYLDLFYPDKQLNFYSTILPQVKNIVRDSMLACYKEIDKSKRMHSMEIFGYDFMIDSKFRPWLIEVNTNPCLELSSPYLTYLIPAMVENALKLTVDCMFPPPLGQYLDSCPVNRFELVFHEEVDGKSLLKIMEHRKINSVYKVSE